MKMILPMLAVFCFAIAGAGVGCTISCGHDHGAKCCGKCDGAKKCCGKCGKEEAKCCGKCGKDKAE